MSVRQHPHQEQHHYEATVAAAVEMGLVDNEDAGPLLDWPTAVRRVISVALLLATAHAFAAAPRGGPSASPALLQLGNDVERQLSSNAVSAGALVVVEQGRITLLRGFGKATPDTPFRLGSITKTFTALALLRAAATTDTPLTTPARAILGNTLWRNAWHAQHPVTLNQLLELSAGFADISGAEFASAKPMLHTPIRTALAPHAAGHQVHWPPGLFHSYSNLAPAFSALVVETLTQTAFPTYLRQQVLTPLGMPHATLDRRPGLPGGFKADGATPIEYWHMVYPAFGALNATAREFAAFLLALSTDQFPAALADAVQHRGPLPLYQPLTTLAATNGLTLGYGAGIYGWLRQGQLFVGHGGDADGYRSRYALAPALGRGYLLVFNTDNPRLLRRLSQRIETTLAARSAGSARSKNTAPARVMQPTAFAGRYYPATRRFNPASLRDCSLAAAVVSFDKNQLIVERRGGTSRLTSRDGRLWQFAGDPQPSVVLVEQHNDRLLLGELGNWRQLPAASPAGTGPCRL